MIIFGLIMLIEELSLESKKPDLVLKRQRRFHQVGHCVGYLTEEDF